MDYPSGADVNLHNGKFTDGDPVGGVPASRDPAAHMNAITDELLNVIQQAGLEPDENDLTQLALAVVGLVGGGFDQGPWGASDHIRIPDKPGGFIVQWGMQSGVSVGTQVGDLYYGSGTWTFPVAFPTACLGVLPVAVNSGVPLEFPAHIETPTLVGVDFYPVTTGLGISNQFFLAIGY